jgi:hypothetical protein
MRHKKLLLIGIFGILSISLIGIIIPLAVINLNLQNVIYAQFLRWSSVGVFFFLYIIGTLFFFPFIYSTLTKAKLSLSVRNIKKKGGNPRFTSAILFLFGLPVIFWLIMGNIGYYAIYGFSGGLGELAVNGFLVCIILVMYFCIIPALILGLKKKSKLFNQS